MWKKKNKNKKHKVATHSLGQIRISLIYSTMYWHIGTYRIGCSGDECKTQFGQKPIIDRRLVEEHCKNEIFEWAGTKPNFNGITKTELKRMDANENNNLHHYNWCIGQGNGCKWQSHYDKLNVTQVSLRVEKKVSIKKNCDAITFQWLFVVLILR